MGDDSLTVPQSGSSAPGSTSSSLLAKARAREAGAWQRLVWLYGPVVYQWCRQRSLQPDDAADVGQEVFAAVARKIGEFHGDRSGDSFRGWLWTITSNKIRDQLRRRRGEPQAQGGTAAQERFAEVLKEDPESASAAATPSLKRSLTRRAIELARGQVEERTWQAFWRVAVEGEEVAAAAESLGMSVQAVYDAKYRIRRKIRQELEGLLE